MKNLVSKEIIEANKQGNKYPYTRRIYYYNGFRVDISKFNSLDCCRDLPHYFATIERKVNGKVYSTFCYATFYTLIWHTIELKANVLIHNMINDIFKDYKEINDLANNIIKRNNLNINF